MHAQGCPWRGRAGSQARLSTTSPHTSTDMGRQARRDLMRFGTPARTRLPPADSSIFGQP